MFKFCPECGVKASGGSAKFCSECGFRFSVPSEAPPPLAADPIKPPTTGGNALPVAVPMSMPLSKAATYLPVAQVVVPPAATGAEAQTILAQCMDTIRAARGGNNEAGVKAFRSNCKAYGLSEIDASAFHASLVAEMGAESASLLVPHLVRLIPDEEKRRVLLEVDAASTRDQLQRMSISSDGDSDASRSSFNANSKLNPNSSRGFLSGRYSDHPNCDICRASFDVYKRRHQCRFCGMYVCSACSPIKLLIPLGQQIDGCRGYVESEPQRVCIQCAPRLHPLQDELVAKHGLFQRDNEHQAASRIHVPYSSSMEKECRNAADIVGNFFRDDWGAAKDRSIPASFLEKAHGLAILTIAKAGFLISAQAGTGLVIAKLPDGSWSAPSAIGTVGISGGFEIGGELVEVMIIFLFSCTG
ncbi:hypothetical protein, variant [Aphanomyces invadans]|uniref:FYVE-type domain-containing protein n=1 Tax=Aphanomyces invadans TaxID=157072 RepID=A0A024TZL0_9STRA|nr:hypothetical protein, variant [Aphanomyces invadans]ETV99418.1 hypothetical protein, variant [Aphanomyces invadans]|eukprot:XP_008871974.1 hypothetical protein, variant [Aphanomyces invadans]